MFKKIQKLVSLLLFSTTVCTDMCVFAPPAVKELGYGGFTVAFYKECTELVGTRLTVNCFNTALIEYLHAVIVSGTELLY